MKPEIRQFDPREWPVQAARLIQDRISAILLEQGRCSVMLTGGRSAERLYVAWAELPIFTQMAGVRFYFGDERCVQPGHPESNYGMAMRTLFKQGVPTGCAVFRLEAELEDREGVASRYEDILPEKIDVLLLGVGEDGHIASLFPGAAALQEQKRRVLPIIGPKPPFERLTITPLVVMQARGGFVLATGAAKAQVLVNAWQAVDDFDRIPARLALKNAIWLLDSQLPKDGQ